jgi:hypothetical protein
MLQDYSTDTSLRRAYNVSLAVLGILLLGSIVFYKHRVLFVDPAWISFDILNRGKLSIQEHRYGSFITQMWLLIANKLHLPMKAALMLYSISFYAFYFSVAWIVGCVLKQYAVGILLVMYFTLFVSDVYFWPNNEVHQGTGWMMLFLGLFFKYQKEGKAPWWGHALMLLTMFLAVFSHFIVIVPFTFVGLYRVLDSKHYLDTKGKWIQLGCYLAAGAVLFLIKLNMGRTGWYDSQLLSPVLHATIPEVIASFASGSAMTMLGLMVSNYWIVIPVFIAGLVMQIRLKKWLPLALTVGYVAGFFSLVCLTYADAYGRETLFYMESEWMAWGILLATPFVLYVLPRIQPRVAVGIVAVVFAVRLGYIWNAYLYFNKRYETLAAITEMLHKQGTNKVILIGEKKESNAVFVMDWGATYESVLLSAIKGYEPQVSFRIVQPDFQVKEPNEHLLLTPFGDYPVAELPQHFFHLDGKTPYKVMQLKDVLRAVGR